MFKISGGKGFQMTFSNGWTVSVQWGINNYCEHYNRTTRSGENLDTVQRDVGAEGSNTAEIAAWDKDKNWHKFEDDTVMGWVHPDQVANFITLIANK